MSLRRATKKPIPYDFVLEAIDSAAPYTNPMFGCTAVYVENKIVFILREKKEDVDNGVWLATTAEHHSSLQKDFPSMRSITVFGPGPTGWQVLPADADDFEDSVLRACEFVLRHDRRIGKIPKSKLRTQKKTKTKSAARSPAPKSRRRV